MESVYTTLIASRGWHVYQKTTWKSPKKGEALECKRETDPVALRFDPYSIAFTRRSIEFLTPLTVGHMPLEISRFVWFFLERGGDINAKVCRTKCEESPIPKGGLEIVTEVTFKIEEEKKRYLQRPIDLINKHYETPKSDVQSGADVQETTAETQRRTAEKENDKDTDDEDENDVMFFVDDEEDDDNDK